MWLFTPFGFFSIVQKPHDTHLTVRARVAADLDALRQRYLPQLAPTTTISGTDYPYRATVSHAALSAALAVIATDLVYDNFKSEVEAVQGAARAHVYADVWSVLATGLPELDAGGKRRRHPRESSRNTAQRGRRS